MRLVRAIQFLILLSFTATVQIAVFPVRANAQQRVGGEFRLSKEVHWEQAVLPPGDYEFLVDSSQRPASVRVLQKGGGFSGVFIPVAFLRPGRGNTQIVLESVGNDTYVTRLHVQGLSADLDFNGAAEGSDTPSVMSEQTREYDAAAVQSSEFFTIVNPKREKISPEAVDRVYRRACEGLERELNRPDPVRPRVVLRLGAAENVLDYTTHEIRLVKWDDYRFAAAILELALFDLLTPEQKTRLSNFAVNQSRGTVTLCELKSCAN